MKKIGLGIALLLFAIVLKLCSSGLDLIALGVGAAGLFFAIGGFSEKEQ